MSLILDLLCHLNIENRLQKIKKKLSIIQKKYPDTKIFGITTGLGNEN